MIVTDRTITVRKGVSSIDDPVIVYRGDYEVAIRFTIMNNKFKFMSGVNMIESEKASYGQLAILTPYGGNVFSDMVRCSDGAVTFVMTKELMDQIEEVGLYSFQIRLFDANRESRVSIPPVEFGIEVREPVASEDHDNSVNNAIVGYSIAKVVDHKEENIGPTFDGNGDYNETKWVTGDRITQGKLNKIEDAINTINQNEKNDIAALDKRITSNFNVLDSTKANQSDLVKATGDIADVNKRISNIVASGGNGTKDSELVEARKNYTTLYDRLEVLEDGIFSPRSEIISSLQIGSFNVYTNVDDGGSPIRCVMPHMGIKFPFKLAVSCDPVAKFCYTYVNVLGEGAGSDGEWHGSDETVVFDNVHALRLAFSYVDDRDITQNGGIGALMNHFHFAIDGRASDAFESELKSEKPINLFDKTKYAEIGGHTGKNGYYNASVGTWVSSDSYDSTGLIPVEPGKVYRDRELGQHIYIQIAFWDENLNPRQGISSEVEDGYIRVPKDKTIKYLTLPVRKSERDTKMIVEVTEDMAFPDEYIPYKETPDTPQLAKKHIQDVYDKFNDISEDLDELRANFAPTAIADVMHRDGPVTRPITLEEVEYDTSASVYTVYNKWFEGSGWFAIYFTKPHTNVTLHRGCLMLGYNDSYYFGINSTGDLYRFTPSESRLHAEYFDTSYRPGTLKLSKLNFSFTIEDDVLTIHDNEYDRVLLSISKTELEEATGNSGITLASGAICMHDSGSYPADELILEFEPADNSSNTYDRLYTLEQELADLQKEVANIKQSAEGGNYNHWNGKTWYAYGTSITSVAQGNYVPYVAKLGGMNFVNKGIPGGSLTNLGGYGKGQIKNAVMNTTDGKLAADLITLETGPNEGNETPMGDRFSTGDDTYCGCLTQCIRYLQENTNAQIVVIASVSTTTHPSESQVYHDRLLLIEEVCKINNVYFISTYTGLGQARIVANGTKYTVDNIHQSKLGGFNQANAIWGTLKNIPLFYSSTDDLPTL